jgi:hypothetical protein
MSTTRVVTADRYAWMTPVEGVPGRFQHNVAAHGDQIAVSAEEAKRGDDLGLLAKPRKAEPVATARAAEEPPARNGSRDDWAAYALTLGATESDLEGQNRDYIRDLVDLHVASKS